MGGALVVGSLWVSILGCVTEYGVTGEADAGGSPNADESVDTAFFDTGATDTNPPLVDSGGDDAVEETDSDEAAADTDTPVDDPPVDTGVPDDSGDDAPVTGCAPGVDGDPVGCTLEVGPGRLFLWGDEHVRFEEYRPDSERFWAGALTWLADSGRVTVDDRTYSNVISATAADLVLPISRDADIVIVDLFSGATATDIAAWLAEGRAVMVMAIGFGSSECSMLAAVTTGLPLSFDCSAEPWGPVGAFTAHPIATGLASGDAPFVNGRMVVADDPSAAEAVAFIP
jgi:hypothetical protein